MPHTMKTPEEINQTLHQNIQMMRHLCEPPASTREGRDRQCVYADATVLVALKTVQGLLPPEIQATVRWLLQLHEAVWYPERNMKPINPGHKDVEKTDTLHHP